MSKWTKNLWLDSLLEEVFIGSPLDTGSNLLLVEAENLTLGPDKSACFGLSCKVAWEFTDNRIFNFSKSDDALIKDDC